MSSRTIRFSIRSALLSLFICALLGFSSVAGADIRLPKPKPKPTKTDNKKKKDDSKATPSKDKKDKKHKKKSKSSSQLQAPQQSWRLVAGLGSGLAALLLGIGVVASDRRRRD